MTTPFSTVTSMCRSSILGSNARACRTRSRNASSLMMLSWFRGGAPPCASAGGAGRVQPLHDLLDLQQPAVAARFSARSAPARRSRIRPWQRPNRSDWPASPSVGSAPVTFLAQNLAFILDLATLLLVGENHDRGAVYFDRDVLFSTPGNSAFRTYLSPASVTSMSMRGKSRPCETGSASAAPGRHRGTYRGTGAVLSKSGHGGSLKTACVQPQPSSSS